MKEIVLAGGCFWGLERLLMDLNGVVSTNVGYAGGKSETANYNVVKTGSTNHAEAVRLQYDSSVISLEEILHFFFKIHDPTTLNQQGNDIGSQYRSTIFVSNEEEKEISLKVISDVNEAGHWQGEIVTTIEIGAEYFDAEEYHQKYLVKHPEGYNCHFIRNW